MPHHRPTGGAGTNNYAMAVKRTLDPKKEHTNNAAPPASSAAPLMSQIGTFNRGTNIQTEQSQILSPRSKWFDRNIRSPVNAKEIEGGPKINGRLEFNFDIFNVGSIFRSIVNGINLNSLKFVKPARQCPKWDKPKHRIDEPNCPLWHPRERCQ